MDLSAEVVRGQAQVGEGLYTMQVFILNEDAVQDSCGICVGGGIMKHVHAQQVSIVAGAEVNPSPGGEREAKVG